MLSALGATDVKVQNFKKECKDSVTTMIAKLEERFPLQHTVVRMTSSLSQHNMARAKKKSLTCFSLLAEKVVKLKWMKLMKLRPNTLASLTQNAFCSRVSSWHLMQPMTVLTRPWVHSCMVRKNMRAYGRFTCLCLFCHMAKMQLRGGSVLMRICLWKIWSTSHLLASEWFTTTCFSEDKAGKL